jgi:hemoglobin/transferrin/lactoferrin receptor protein
LGGGSPMIRGFAANRILIVFDGVRMNNAIFRSGNLQNIISIDPNTIAEAEVVFGPGSVIYGSDALGGVMDFHTKNPEFAFSEKISFKVNSLLRYSSADNENTGHIDLNIGLKKIAFFTSYTFTKFDDLRMGKNGPDEYLRPEYVDVLDSADIIVRNLNPEIQKFSGYSQQNFLQKIAVKLSSHTQLIYLFNYSETSNVPRYDRLIQYKGNSLKYAQWYYGPQKWMMNKLQLSNNSKTKIYDNLKVNLAFQDYTESRHDRKFNKSAIRERTENVKIGTINFDALKELNSSKSIYYGIEANYNYVSSTGQLRDILTNTMEAYPSRYPDGSTYQNYDAYLQFKSKFNDKLTSNLGIRFSQVLIKAVFDTTFYKFPFTQANLSPRAITGSMGISYKMKNYYNLALNLSSGFRAPNIDDIGKVFDSEPGNVVVPNKDLQPEYIYDAEVILHKTRGKYFFNFATFFSYLDNAMVRRDFTFNGQDSIIYDGTMSKVQALVNADYAIIYGLQANAGMQIQKHLIVKTAVNYLQGHDKEGNAIRHIPPPNAAFDMIFFTKKIKANLYTVYNAQISYENLAPSERDKPHIYATDENGNPFCPQWWTLNFNFQYKIKDFAHFNVGVENILDKRYRPYSSGIVAPGRNFIISLKFMFK